MAKIKRSLFKTYLDTTPSTTATWVLLNPGITSAKIAYNPKTTSETWIHEDTASTSIDSYAPTLPIEATITNAEAAFEYLDAFRKTRATLSSAETHILNVYAYKGASALVSPKYLAEKQNVSIQIDKYGGAGGSPSKLNYTINYLGDPTIGLFDGTNFVAANATCKLASLAFTSSALVLTPAFSPDRIWYKATTSDASNVITAVAQDLASPCIVTIDNDGIPVVSGAAATWLTDPGVNHVTITCTIGAVTRIYVVLVTKT
jgi:hypothetical protein